MDCLFGQLRQLTRDRHLEVGTCCRRRRVDELLCLGLGRDSGLARLSVTGMNATVWSSLIWCAPSGSVRAGHQAHVGERLDLADHLVDTRLHIGIGHFRPTGRGKDDLLGVAGDPWAPKPAEA